MRHAARVCLALAALILAAGAVLHARAFPAADAVIAASGLPVFHAGAFRALWWSDIAVSLILAALFAGLAVRPSVLTKGVALLVSGLPLSTALSILVFLGPFYAADLLLFAGGSAMAGVLLAGAAPLPAQPSTGATLP